MIHLLLTFLVSFSSMAALSLEDLNSVFATKNDLGPMSIEKIRQLDEAFYELGIQEQFIQLQMKLDRHELDFLPQILHVCELEEDTLGTYQRGESLSTNSTIGPDSNIDDLKVFWAISDPEKFIEENYKTQILNNGPYVSLMVMQWPVICIRPNMTLANVISTFAHEIEHFIGDEEKEIDLTKFTSEHDYVQKELVSSGGEFEAYQAGAKVDIVLEEYMQRKNYSTLLKFFNDEGELTNENGLKKYILKTLDYESKFINNYRDIIVKSYNYKVDHYNSLIDWFALYESNYDISLGNLEVYESNIKVYENNIEYYEYYKNEAKVKEIKTKLEQTKADIIKTTNAIRFYQNMIELKFTTLNEVDSELSQIQILIDKVRNELGQ